MNLSTTARHAATVLVGSLICAAAPVYALVAPPPAFSSVFVLGDSLSDNGNLFAMSGFYPPAPYFGGRFSDGRVAVEVLAEGLLGANSPNFHDLAIGGARTGLVGSGDALAGQPTGMLTQLGTFQSSFAGSPALGEALFVVWGGANDMRDGLVNGTVGASMAAAIGNLSTIVDTLHGMGATKFLLPNLPDLGLTPEARANGPAASAGASFVSELFNQNLTAAYAGLAAQWNDETFYYFDAMAAQRAITNGAPGNGFTNVDTACIGTGGCATALYFDSIHPTAAAHLNLGNQMLAAVPEPQTMLLMAVGLLGLLAATRRRQA